MQTMQPDDADLGKILLLFLMREFWSHGTMQPSRSLVGTRNILFGRNLFNSLPLFIL